MRLAWSALIQPIHEEILLRVAKVVPSRQADTARHPQLPDSAHDVTEPKRKKNSISSACRPYPTIIFQDVMRTRL